MTYTLRDYQQQASDVIVKHLTAPEDKPVVVTASVGAGKSLIIADVCHRLNKPVLILQPSVELLHQNYAKLASYGVDDISIYSASAGSKEIGKYTFATIGSVYKKPELFEHFKFVLVDECDAVGLKDNDNMYRKLFDGMGGPKVAGLTATPYRVETKYAWDNGNLYSSAAVKMLTRIGHPTFWSGGIVFKIETRELIEQGYLSPIKYHSDTDAFYRLLKVNTTGADFTKDSLREWGAAKVERIADYCQWVDDKAKRNLVFCASVSQAHKVNAALQQRGLASAVVSADTPPKEREQIVADFRSGKVRHMVNCLVFLVGFDVPELSCIIYARPTLSPRVWYQCIGRGVRLDPASPDKILRVFDLSGTLQKIGPVETLRLGKAEDGYRDALYGKRGQLDEKPLYKFRMIRKGR